MTASIVGTLSCTQIQQAQQQSQAIAGAATQTIGSNQFVFFAAFDGTNNSLADYYWSNEHNTGADLPALADGDLASLGLVDWFDLGNGASVRDGVLGNAANEQKWRQTA